MLFIRTSEKEDLLFNLYRVTDLKVENPGTILQWCKFASVQFSSVQSLSRIQLLMTPWTVARKASLSITPRIY